MSISPSIYQIKTHRSLEEVEFLGSLRVDPREPDALSICVEAQARNQNEIAYTIQIVVVYLDTWSSEVESSEHARHLGGLKWLQ